MYTLKGSIGSKLPATSYTKFIDIWLLYGLIMPFFILIVIFLIEHLPENSQVKKYLEFISFFVTNIFQILHCSSNEKTLRCNPLSQKEKAEKFGKVYLPIIQAVFVIAYAVVAVILYYN